MSHSRSWEAAARIHDGPRPRFRFVVTAALSAAAGSCSCCHKPCVDAVEIVPPAVVVGPGPAQTASFELEARLWTGTLADRHSIADQKRLDDLQWSSNAAWLVLVRQDRNRAVFNLSGAVPTTGAEALVTAKVDGVASPAAKIDVVTPDLVAGNDTLHASYAADLPPSASVVNAAVTVGAGCADSLVGFVRTSVLGQQVAPCPDPGAPWGLALLAVDHAMTLEPYAWTPGTDAADRVGAQGSLRSLPVALWVAIGPNDLDPGDDMTQRRHEVMDLALADLELADTIFAANRAGIAFSLVDSVTVTDGQALAAIGNDCFTANALTTHYVADVINVYYVEELQDIRGVECGARRTEQNAIYVSWTAHSSSTLAHELGHLLSLTLPRDGHTDALSGFDLINVMASGLSDADARGRDQFTIGQVFRMNTDSASWLNRATNGGQRVRDVSAPRLACQCQIDSTVPPCPGLGEDLAPASQRVGEFHDWDCFDELHLKGTNGTYDAVGLIAGRRWRSPTQCSADLPASLDRHFGTEVRLEFDNLTHPGDCPSWAAIFFQRHGMMYRKLVEKPDTLWNDTRDERLIFDPVPERVEIPVHITYEQLQLKTPAAEDTVAASQVFGADNPTGIALVFDLAQGSVTAACSASLDAAPEVWLTYASETPIKVVSCIRGETRSFVINESVHRPTTVPHYLGLALGLAKVNSPDQFMGNLMLQQPGDRGTHLTLGQVFRINVTLGRVEGIDSCTGSTACPSLGADSP
jgi:hypothetical protein